MKITILTVGKIKEKYLRDAIAEYSKRLSRYAKLEIIEVADEKTPDNASETVETNIKNKEAERLLKYIRDDAYLITLEIKGKQLTSEELAQKIDTLGVQGTSHIIFVIGGSLGLGEEVLKRSNYALSFSKMTFKRGVIAMREMRLKKREITDPEILRKILESCEVVRIGAMDEEGMFIVPMNYGYDVREEDGTLHVCLYLHGAKEGRKAAAFAADPRVAVEMDYNHEVITGDYTCAYSYAYRSIMGNGTITEVTDPEAKKKGLGKIMAHIAPEAKIAFLPEMVERVAVWRIDIDTFTGKERRRK